MFLLDANVLIYRLTVSPYRDACAELIAAVVEGRAPGSVSTAVLEEVWRVELKKRIEGMDGATATYHDIFAPLMPVTDDIFKRALTIESAHLGAMDRIHAATCLESGIRTIVSADTAFDGVRGLRRVDPLDARAVERLLA